MSLLHGYRMTPIEEDDEHVDIRIRTKNWINIMQIVQLHEYDVEQSPVLRELAEQYLVMRNLTR